MNCFFCKHGTTESGKTTKVIEYNSNLIIIKNIPCMECEQCGEKYYTDDVMKQL